jgi:hypothetical protein
MLIYSHRLMREMKLAFGGFRAATVCRAGRENSTAKKTFYESYNQDLQKG